jgi:hypothetical protein
LKNSYSPDLKTIKVKKEYDDVAEALRDHKKAATSAKDAYRDAQVSARRDYQEGSVKWNELRRLHVAKKGPLDVETIRSFAKIFSKESPLITECDYQQDKSCPAWNKSAQPVPTFFMSKSTTAKATASPVLLPTSVPPWDPPRRVCTVRAPKPKS